MIAASAIKASLDFLNKESCQGAPREERTLVRVKGITIKPGLRSYRRFRLSSDPANGEWVLSGIYPVPESGVKEVSILIDSPSISYGLALRRNARGKWAVVHSEVSNFDNFHYAR